MYLEFEEEILHDIKTVLNNKNQLKIIGVEKNLDNIEFIITEYIDSGIIRIMLYNSEYKREYGRNPALWGSYNSERAQIDLVEPLKDDQGNDIILIKYFKEVVNQLGIEKVSGQNRVPEE